MMKLVHEHDEAGVRAWWSWCTSMMKLAC